VTLLWLFFAVDWSSLAPLPQAQAGAAVARLGETMVVAGGTHWEGGQKLWLADVQVYDLRGRQWRPGPALPEKLAYGPFIAGSDRLEIFGGSPNSRTIWRFESQRWTKAGETPSVHILGRAARVGKRVFLFGGCGEVGDLATCSDAVWMREGEGVWRQVAKLPGGAVALSAVAVTGQQIFLFGGCAFNGQIVNRAEAWRFDPRTFEFHRLRDLPAKNRGLTATAVAGRIWLFGGYTSEFTAAVFTYDPARDTYTSETPLPVAMSSIEFIVRGGELIGTGGEDRMKGRSGRTFIGRLKKR